MKKSRRLVVLLFLACSFLLNIAEAQDTTARLSPTEDYRIGPADIVSVYIIRMPELSREYPVSALGTIDVPFLGSLNAREKTSQELAALIAERLRGDFLVDPQVTVIVKPTIFTRKFFIQGAVRSPGVYSLETRPSLLELISIAGGLNTTYGATAFVIHKVSPSVVDTVAAKDSGPAPEYELRKANINALLRGEFGENLKIEPEDIVQIPLADVFFVAGEVKAPGSFQLKESTTLRQAISLAQGSTPTAAPARGIIFREDATGQKREIPIDVSAVMSGKKPDLAIFANDIIVIPNSKAKSVFVPVLNAFGINAAYAATRVILP